MITQDMSWMIDTVDRAVPMPENMFEISKEELREYKRCNQERAEEYDPSV